MRPAPARGARSGEDYEKSLADRWRKGVVDHGKIVPFNPNAANVSNVLDALTALAQLHGDVSFPFWRDGRTFPPATEILSCANGLLHLPTRKLLPHTLNFVNLWSLGYDCGPNASEPTGWTTFLKELWPEDQESIDTLQEIFGLLLTGDTSYQKAFLIVGPQRGGKGTIGRILRMLLGPNNVAGPTLKELETNFGLSPLIHKPLAIISDARLSGKMDSQIVIERLLSTTGEDSLNVPRKFLPDWIGQLPTRFLILTNELPNFPDTSGAI